MPALAPDFARLLAPGTGRPCPDGDDSLTVRALPGVPLSLPSGRVAAMEPFACGAEDPDEVAFVQRVLPGTYRVVLLVADFLGPDGGLQDSRVAAARLEIRDEPVTDWELAVLPGEDAEELDEDELFGYPVDGGMGCFVDAETLRTAEDPGTGEEPQHLGDRVLDALMDGPRSYEAPLTLSVGEDAHAMVAFSTGWGDGHYATWVGRTADGDIACFLTDFQVATDEDDDEEPGPAA